MALVICKHPAIRIDIMVLRKYQPRVVSMIQNCECTYYKEEVVEQPGKNAYVILRDVKPAKGLVMHGVTSFIGNLYAEAARNHLDEETGEPQKFYVLIRPRKKVKKNVQKNRSQVNTGSESGDSGEPKSDEPGDSPELGANGSEPDISGIDPGDIEVDIPEGDTDGGQ